jgi:RNA recognition motif-containing protein
VFSNPKCFVSSVEATIITRGHRSLGYGFITFETEKDATKATQALDRQSLDGREINVEVARPKAPPADTTEEETIPTTAAPSTTSKSKRNNIRRRRRRNRNRSKSSATNVSLELGREIVKRRDSKLINSKNFALFFIFF